MAQRPTLAAGAPPTRPLKPPNFPSQWVSQVSILAHVVSRSGDCLNQKYRQTEKALVATAPRSAITSQAASLRCWGRYPHFVPAYPGYPPMPGQRFSQRKQLAVPRLETCEEFWSCRERISSVFSKKGNPKRELRTITAAAPSLPSMFPHRRSNPRAYACELIAEPSCFLSSSSPVSSFLTTPPVTLYKLAAPQNALDATGYLTGTFIVHFLHVEVNLAFYLDLLL